jgi:hypothetical protein
MANNSALSFAGTIQSADSKTAGVTVKGMNK